MIGCVCFAIPPSSVPSPWSLSTFFVSSVTPGYMLTSEYLELGTTGHKKYVELSFCVQVT